VRLFYRHVFLNQLTFAIMSQLNTQIIEEIHALSDKTNIPFYTHFFRADKGDICFGDKFLAIKIHKGEIQ
jgi:hypothetical protein